MAKENGDRFKELIVYISRKCSSDDTFGATKLNKILFFCDFLRFGELGTSITGEEYWKLPNGPAPKRLIQVKSEMLNKDVAEIQRPYFGKFQKRLVPLREPNLKVFSPEEIAFIDEVISAIGGRNASEVSRLSHDKSVGWWNVGIKEVIPYETVFFPNPEEVVHSEEDRIYSKELGRRLGWDTAYGWN